MDDDLTLLTDTIVRSMLIPEQSKAVIVDYLNQTYQKEWFEPLGVFQLSPPKSIEDEWAMALEEFSLLLLATLHS